MYVRRDLHEALQQPIWGWFGQRDQFAMGPDYDPVPSMARFLVGTPQVLGAVLVEEGARMLGEAGIEQVRAKGVALTSYLIELYDAWLEPLGFTLASPRDSSRRGSHVSLAHPEAYRICRALIEKASVIPDFRAPDRIRLGLASLTTSFVDVWEAMDRMRSIVTDGTYLDIEETRARVT
jgi:kynureninase